MGVRAVAGTVLVVAVLAGGAVVADGVIRQRTEDRLAADLQQQIVGLDAPPDVTIGGWPFLTQVAGGELEQVDITADQAVVEGLTLQDVTVRLTGVSTDQPTTARTVELTGAAPVAGLAGLVDLPGELTTRDGALVAQGEVLGLPLEITLQPRAAGREIAVEVQDLTVGGGAVDLGGIPGLEGALDDLRIPVEQLPEGLELTEVRVERDAILLRAAGEDVVLRAPTAG